MTLHRFQRKRIALIMDVQGREVVLRGTTSLREDARQGQVLQITVADDDDAALGAPVFLISEERWKDNLVSGVDYDCDFLLDLSQQAVTAS